MAYQSVSHRSPLPSSRSRHCRCRQLRSFLGCAIVYNTSVATTASCAFLDDERSAGFVSFLPIAITSIILFLARKCMICMCEFGRARVNEFDCKNTLVKTPLHTNQAVRHPKSISDVHKLPLNAVW